MSDDPAPKPRRTFVVFRRFRRQHADLSSLYWMHQLGAQVMKKHLRCAESSQLAVTTLGVELGQLQFGFTNEETIARLPIYLDTCRLHILAICLAQLESYLKRLTYFVARQRDPSPTQGKLSPVAQALAAPILERDSLVEPLRFAEHLFRVDLSAEIKVLTKGYRYRCAAVHNGGYATPRSKKELGLTGAALHSRLAVTWPHLKEIMEAVHTVADKLDEAVYGPELANIEVICELDTLHEQNALPHRSKVWAELASQGFLLPKKRDRLVIEIQYYG